MSGDDEGNLLISLCRRRRSRRGGRVGSRVRYGHGHVTFDGSKTVRGLSQGPHSPVPSNDDVHRTLPIVVGFGIDTKNDWRRPEPY